MERPRRNSDASAASLLPVSVESVDKASSAITASFAEIASQNRGYTPDVILALAAQGMDPLLTIARALEKTGVTGADGVEDSSESEGEDGSGNKQGRKLTGRLYEPKPARAVPESTDPYQPAKGLDAALRASSPAAGASKTVSPAAGTGPRVPSPAAGTAPRRPSVTGSAPLRIVSPAATGPYIPSPAAAGGHNTPRSPAASRPISTPTASKVSPAATRAAYPMSTAVLDAALPAAR
jgi:hypothetical protein